MLVTSHLEITSKKKLSSLPGVSSGTSLLLWSSLRNRFETDDEAFDIWEKKIGFPKERIYRFEKRIIFGQWAMLVHVGHAPKYL